MGELAQKERNQIKQQTRPHNYGADLIRCLAMLMIVVLHLYTRGGALSAINQASPNGGAKELNYAIQWICFGGVNLYGLLSGYLMLESSFKPRRFFGLWLQVVFTGLVLNAAGALLKSEFISAETWIRAVLPVSQREFWYFTCYTCVFLLSPVLNRGIRALTRQQAAVLLVGCLIVFCLLSSLGYSYNGDPFYVVGGYSALWLIALYVMGACLKQSGLLEKTKTSNLAIIMLICLAVDVFWHFLPLPKVIDGSKKIANTFFGLPMVLFDLCLFALVIRAEFHGEAFKKLLRWLSPLTFSVYLITVHPLSWGLMNGSVRFVAKLSLWLAAPILIGIGVLIFTVCVFADVARVRLFRLIRADAFCAWLEKRTRSVLNKFTRLLLGRK